MRRRWLLLSIPLMAVIAAGACRKEIQERTSGGIASAAKDEVSTRGLEQRASLPASQAVNLAAVPPPPPPPPQRSDAFARMIIRTATLSMIVDDTRTAMEKLTTATESAGGYVSDSRVWREGELLRGNMSLRVPSNRLTPALSSMRQLAVRIQSESIGSQEVTQEYVDLESQLRNMEAAEIELRQLMTTMREKSKRASEVLEIYQQLMSIRAQIEQTKGRLRYLGEMTSMASVNVELVPNALARPVVEPGWQPLLVAREASRALVGAMQRLASVAIWVAIYLLPILAMLAIALFAAWKIFARLLRRTQPA